MTDRNHLKKLIREVPDFPKPGILFYDITTLLRDGPGFHEVIDALKEHYRGTGVDMVIGIEARGFIFAPALAYALGTGFVPVRKPKKLPSRPRGRQLPARVRHRQPGDPHGRDRQRPPCLIVDDLLATGGTAAAVTKLVEQVGGKVVGLGFVVELTFLKGRAKLAGHDVFSMLQYDK